MAGKGMKSVMSEKIRKLLNWIILSVSSIMLIVLVLGALWQVFSRYVLGAPSTFTNELLGFLLVWVSLLGASYAFGSNEHLSLSFLVDKIKGKNRLFITVLNDLFILMFAVLVLIKGGMQAVSMTMTQVTPVLGVRMGLVYSILPISGVIIVIYKLLGIMDYRKISNKVDEQYE